MRLSRQRRQIQLIIFLLVIHNNDIQVRSCPVFPELVGRSVLEGRLVVTSQILHLVDSVQVEREVIVQPLVGQTILRVLYGVLRSHVDGQPLVQFQA